LLFDFIPSFLRGLSGSDPYETTNKALYECWKFDLGCHAYFSCGAARGSEIRRLPDFKDCQFIWNSIRFQLRSNKNQAHGKNHNEKVVHWLPPSASRRTIICHHIIYPALEGSSYKLPEDTKINTALSEMFAKTMNLQKALSPKINRDFISVLTDYIAPSSLAKTSTTEQMASHFHHSRDIHNVYYSAETFQRDKDGNMVPGPLSVAHQVWHAMGEKIYDRPMQQQRPTNNHIVMTQMTYDLAAKRAYQDPSARVTDLQYQAVSHASSKEINKHAFVLMGCGTGKSGVYNLLLLGAYLHMSNIPKTMVISPHNSLLEMHKLQSRHYLRGTNLSVISISPSDVENKHFPTHFDLVFISIHAFNELLSEYRHIILQWKLENIFVDEYHNVIGELFRFSSAWQCLRIIPSLNVKIMLLSATSEVKLMSSIATFMNLGDFEVIGSADHYPLPNIRIHVIANEQTLRRDSLFNKVLEHCQKIVKKKQIINPRYMSSQCPERMHKNCQT
jgi:hypothetical protein